MRLHKDLREERRRRDKGDKVMEYNRKDLVKGFTK